jgi:fructose-1,6-bisphosphatase/inositol monophosphatase family enzyme
MSITLSDLLIDCTRLPSRKILRDYYELESLQNTGKHNDNFVLQSLKRIKENISTELLKHKITSTFFFKGEKKPEKDLFIYVMPIDSLSSFSRAKPFFGMMATLFRNNEPEMSVINFPSTKEILYAAKDKGVWVEKLNRNEVDPIKIRTSNIQDISSAHIVADNIESIINNKDYCNSFRNVEVINSPLYNLYLTCHGIIDASIISIDCEFFLQSLLLIAKESNSIVQLAQNNKHALITNAKISALGTIIE